ncbi:MAG: Uma2 family endonuclease, partial [Gomphosphaeria aponina SAG 52.96 = DSM 107014]|nr:Uma2 family endonuclease [Gomphosphaeria aponina SAG 52.96 = DSM 107014]
IYQNQLQVPEYFWFDPFNPQDLAGFSLQNANYQPLEFNEQNQLISRALNLALGRWPGEYKGINTTWLRWATSSGELLPNAEEIALQEKQRAQEEKQRADLAESKLRQTARNLLQEGMTIQQVASLTGLSEMQINQLN